MKKVTGKLMSILLCLVAITSVVALPASAENVTDTAAMAYMARSSDSAKVYTNATEHTTDSMGAVSTRGANVVNKTTSISVGNSYSTSFKMDNLFSGPHNAFSISVRNAGGPYSVTVTKSDGTWSKQFDARSYDSTMTVDGCVAGVTYTVYVINAGTNAINPTISVTSYVK